MNAKIENNNRFLPHIKLITHIMMLSHFSCFSFNLFSAQR
ncbi:leader peptide SpeFL [Proteus mirabilis]|nr:leader peptide SpeFL [Proteus mirabilis]